MDKLESERTGSLLEIQEQAYSFVPHKLSDDALQIELDKECVSLLSDAERYLGELKGIMRVLHNPDLFLCVFIRKEAILSSQIEGTQCSLEDIIEIDDETDEMKPVYEVVNYIHAMNKGIEQIKDLPMSIRLINEIHSTLLQGVRGDNKQPGEFRKSQNWIGPPGSTIQEAQFVPPPPNKVLDLMGDWEKYYHQNSHLPVLIKAAILHAHFETIHPYLDGNGRLGRLLIVFMLCEKGIIHSPLVYPSLFFKEHRSDYYQLLMDVRTKGNWEEWIKFFLRGIRETSIDAIKTGEQLFKIQNEDLDKVKQKLSGYRMAYPFYDYIRKKPIISIPEISKSMSLSYPASKQLVEKFVELDILILREEKKRGKSYEYKRYLDVLRPGL
jgi:Fic family protein